MSDTPSTTEYTSSRISFSPDLKPREGEATLDEDAAVKLLAQRFGGPATRENTFMESVGLGLGAPYHLLAGTDSRRNAHPVNSEAYHGLMTRLVRMLPAEYRTASVLTNVDFRPILSELILTESQAARTRAVHYVNDVPVLPSERVEAGRLLVEQNQVIEDQAFAVAAALEEAGEFADAPDPAAARQAWINARVNGWRQRRDDGTGEMGPIPQLEMDALAAETLPQQDAINEQLGTSTLYDRMLAETGMIDASQTPYAWISEEDVRFMFQMDMVQWADVIENERNKIDARAAGMAGVPADMTVDTGGLLPGRPKLERSDIGFGGNVGGAMTGSGSTKIRLLDVFNSLYSSKRTPVELRNLQDKLIAGGYLEEDDVRYWGKATDDATVRAWRTLVRDSINLGKDMNALLAEATLAKREEDEEASKAMQRDLVLSSSIGVQTTADVLGQQVLGRKLSGEQHARLVEFIHNLEREQHSALAPEGGQQAEEVDVEAEVAAWIERENGVEAGAYDVLEQFQTFNQIARRPG